MTSDHPRSCGANDTAENIAFAQDGSSPLVRGQPLVFNPIADTLRIIPARAGPTINKGIKTIFYRIIPARAGPTV